MNVMRIVVGLAVLAASVALVPAASGAVIVTTWDAGALDGWTWNTANTYGRWEVMTTGGTPDGYVRFYDKNSTYAADDLHAAAAYLGSYSGLDPDARFEFDMRAENTSNWHATILMSGPNGSAMHTTTTPGASWEHYVLPLQQSSWIVTGGTWSGLLANITDIRIVGDVVTGHNQAELALDNFALVPEPATLVLLAISGLALWRRRPV